MSQNVPIGIIGGSGLYEIEGLNIVETLDIDTPFGKPSAPIVIGEIDGRRVAFLPRHGQHHQHSPTHVPYRANIWALKSIGVFWLVTVSAVGSLKEEIVPGHFAIPDQIIDKTVKRPNSMFDEIAVHVGLSRPFHPMLRDVLLECVKAEGITVHDGGTYVCMEGPAFSTIAESELHRAWGASLIGMTAMPEARLAREAEMCYATIALPTDYDVWHEDDHVDVSKVMEIIRQNVSNVRRVLKRVIPAIPLGKEAECDASQALQYAIMTKPEAIPEWTRQNLDIILGKYIG
ncbi:S-methyl-5'-thioadenosine phosphorylase [Microvenator marinus]|jgi:5'-methylthioadenosine phosphorylase|uniref:S-methyl-5'-thioadenosine phosphorylase n=1 Tax=Microvenator marinus TaxID=2600177 RepID=A0A5B8XQM5_9DELT|nr:S-methyl-5'-thioadenosine phosphorylase [Microvenator marinus]QED27278.1 S-methyl-5'-thioadenosine phosphorylase [Microvenator marinus]